MNMRKVGARSPLVMALVAVLLAATTVVGLGSVPSASAAPSPSRPPRPDKLSQPLRELTGTPAPQTSAPGAPVFNPITSGPGSLLSTGPGRVTVEIRVDATTPDMQAAITATGAKITYVNPARRVITADAPVSSLGTISGLRGVDAVNDVLQPQTSASTCDQGIAVSEGDTQLKAALARTNSSVTGSGVKVGVLSDTFAKKAAPATTFPTDVANGDLPGATNTCPGQTTDVNVTDYTSGNDEGRGMAQIVHDLAPRANIDFATAFGGEDVFAQNIRNLQTAGAKVIVDDVTYFAEPMYQDGVVAKAAQDVTDAGTVYYSSAANNNFLVGGLPAASYEAQNGYRAMACPAAVSAGHVDCHDFDPGAGTSDGFGFTWTANRTVRFILGWNEPQGGVVTDYDMYLLDTADNVIASSTNANLTTQKTFEFFGGSLGSNFTGRIVIARKASTPNTSPRFKLVFASNGATPFTAVTWNSGNSTDTFGPTTFGHNAKINAASVAAVPYNNSSVAEGFTSKGPATYCWGPVVTATAAAPLSGGCQTKQIDMAATDGGANTFFGSNVGGTWRFYGTSAAAPHAAAVAALMLEKNPCASPAQIIATQKSTAVAVGAENQATVGSGLVDADAAVAAMNGSACAPNVPTQALINANEGDVVTVDFPGVTSNPAGHALTYGLAQTSGPAIPYIQTSGTTQRKFIAPRSLSNTPMIVTLDLTANDTVNGTSRTVQVVVKVANVAPTAQAGANRSVTTGSVVVLKGGSLDPMEPDTAPSGTTGRQYVWTQTGGTGVTLTPGAGVDFRTASFTPPSVGSYTFQLVVTDHGGTGAASAPSTITIDARTPAPAGTLSGVVKDTGGAPLSGVTVDVLGTPTGSPLASTSTDVNGAWSIGSLSNGTSYYVRFTNVGYGTRWARDGIGATGVRPVLAPSALVDATLTPSASLRTISGIARNSSAAPVGGATVLLFDEVGQLAASTTNGGGGYFFAGLTPKATYRVSIARGNATFREAWATTDGAGAVLGSTGIPTLFFNATGGNVAAPDTTLYNKTTENRTITATVQSAGPTPVTGAEVRVYNTGGYVNSTKVNAGGVYTITGLRPGNDYLVWVWTKCTGCTANALTSQWYNNAPGEQYDRTGKLVSPIDLTAVSPSLTFNLS